MQDLISWLSTMHPAQQALVATLFTWGVTAFGASFVFFFRKMNQKVLDAMLGFAAGVMIAASFWSLLAPAIAMSEEAGGLPKWAPALIGFLSGGLFIALMDKLALPRTYLDHEKCQEFLAGMEKSLESALGLVGLLKKK